MYCGFRNGHRARIAGKEKIHIVNISVDTRQIHAGEMAAWTQIRQVLGMDSDELKLQLFALEGNPEISFTQASLLFDVLFDTILYVLCHHVSCSIGRGLLGVRRCIATRK